jgi:ATP-dependent DNA helicase RecG
VTQEELLEFLRTERTRQEIVDFLGKDTITYTMQQFVEPLIEKGLVKMTIPDKPKSRNQKYYSEKR